MSKILVTGCSGFIGGHLVKYLKSKNHWVRGVDIKNPEFGNLVVDEFFRRDLRYFSPDLFEGIDEVYHLASNMGGIGYIESHKSIIVYDNSLINLYALKSCETLRCVKKFLFTSSACVYPGFLQNNNKAIKLDEESAYPADAEDGYGWEKLMMERNCRHFMEDYRLPIYIARLHNVYGTLGTYQGGREKSPAALCRKVALAKEYEEIEIWGDGKQTRSYCYVDDCVEGLYKLMQSNYHEPINIGTERLVSIDQLADMIIKISGKKLTKIYNYTAPRGVNGRNADITKAQEILGWSPRVSLEEGLARTYHWIQSSLEKK